MENEAFLSLYNSAMKGDEDARAKLVDTRGSYVEDSCSFFQFINHIKKSKRGHGTAASAVVPP